MIDAIQNMIQGVQAVEKSLDQIVLEVVKSQEEEVLKLQLNQQLYKGIDANGDQISPPYAPSTIKRKRQKNDPYDRVTLRNEGDFYESFFIEYRGDEFEIKSSDQKRIYLERKYGSSIYGLNDENIEKLSETIRTPLVEELKKQILQ